MSPRYFCRGGSVKVERCWRAGRHGSQRRESCSGLHQVQRTLADAGVCRHNAAAQHCRFPLSQTVAGAPHLGELEAQGLDGLHHHHLKLVRNLGPEKGVGTVEEVQEGEPAARKRETDASSSQPGCCDHVGVDALSSSVRCSPHLTHEAANLLEQAVNAGLVACLE